MKTNLWIIAVTAVCVVSPLRAQSPGVSGSSSFGSASLDDGTLSIDSFRQVLVSYIWTWHRQGASDVIRFKKDGTLLLSKSKITFVIRSPHDVELLMGRKKAVLHFNGDITSYTGTDFDGVRPIHGRKSDPVGD